MPGFWNGGVFTSREDGAFYASQWARVVQYQPDSVWVNSLNETWEHTSVEPAWLHGRWVANAGISRWNDAYGDRMDDFYWQMTRQYNQIFRNNALFDGVCFQENGSTNIFRASGGNFVPQSALPHQAPVLTLPSGFRTSFSGTVVSTNFTGGSGLASLYNFDEASGSTLVDEVRGLDGEVVGGAARAPGVCGTALVTDGITGCARLPQSPTGDFSWVLWLKTTAAGISATNWWQGRWVLADENSSATFGSGLSLVSGARLAFGVNSSDSAAAAAVARRARREIGRAVLVVCFFVKEAEVFG